MHPKPPIGVLAPFSSDLFLFAVLQGMRAEARQHGQDVVVMHVSPAQAAQRGLGAGRVAGWLSVLQTAGMERLGASGLPVVVICPDDPAVGCPQVLPDNRTGVSELVRHLAGHGHTRIAFIGHEQNSDFRERRESYRETLEALGLEYDPALVQDAGDYGPAAGAEALRRLWATNKPFSAVVASDDLFALGVLEACRAAGVAVPEQLAVVGFDDMHGSDHASPPLSTVHQRPGLLGASAVQLLLRHSESRADVPMVTRVATKVMIRSSCGCAAAPQTITDPPMAGPDWRERLTEAALRTVETAGVALDAQRDWPQAAVLIDELEAALIGSTPPTSEERDNAWRELFQLTRDLTVLLGVAGLFERAAWRRLAAVELGDEARGRVAALGEAMRLRLMRTLFVEERRSAGVIQDAVQVNAMVNLALLQQNDQSIRSLQWLQPTDVTSACLGLWEEGRDGGSTLRMAGVFQRTERAALGVGDRMDAAAFPPLGLLPDGPEAARADIAVMPLVTEARDWGLLAVCVPLMEGRSFVLDNLRLWAGLLGAALDRGALLESLEDQRYTLRLAYDRERALAETIREIGCPVIPLVKGTLLVPLVGGIDSERTQQVMEAVLEGVSRHHTENVLIDITSVPIVDTHVASALLQTARAATLLGARVTLVGVRPEIAQSIVGLGIDLGAIRTQPTLAAALRSLQGQGGGGLPARVEWR